MSNNQYENEENKNINSHAKGIWSIHVAWIIVAITFVTVLTGAGIRSAAAVLIDPLEIEFGWNRAIISTAVGLSLLMYGVAAPISGRLIDSYGPRLVMQISLALMVVGITGLLLMTSFWQLVIFWGIIVGLATGAVASVLSVSVASRWFVERRGLALGILSSSSSTGQLIFIPMLAWVILSYGWRVGSIVMMGAALIILVVVNIWMRNDPEDLGTAPYGLKDQQGTGIKSGMDNPKRGIQTEEKLISLKIVLRHRVFWFLAIVFLICGATSMGLIGTHLILHSIDRGIPEVTAAAAFGIMGFMNFFGSILSGWLTDRINPRKILFFVLTVRGLSLFILPFIRDFAGLLLFGIIFGLSWFATVVPVTVLAANTFGKRSVGTVYGWIFLGHQIGASLAAIGGGTLRVWLGDYHLAMIAGGIMAIAGGALALGIPVKRMATANS
ncbi:MAG: MFS transporter [Clostridia bacterium]|jgi:MFS family permease|nr:MFS transporter [Clostridia bacterium]